jgi:hypothetical protein
VYDLDFAFAARHLKCILAPVVPYLHVRLYVCVYVCVCVRARV